MHTTTSALYLSAVILCVLADPAICAVLRPNSQLSRELLKLDVEHKRYELTDLAPSTSYELRFSYPATIPARILFEVTGSSSDSTQRSRLRHSSRKLLNCEKTIISTDQLGRVQGHEHAAVVIQAQRSSVHRDGPGGGPEYLIYNLVLAQLWYGVPHDAFPLIYCAVALLVVVLIFTPIFTRRLLPRLLDWLTCTEEGSRTKRRT